MSEKVYNVAVITRTKDRVLLLERAIKSIHQQTMRDYIHVIVNDGGDPKPVEALVEKMKVITGDRITLIHNESSLGMEAASNRGLKSVNSKYVAIHDDDDTWHPDFLKKTTEHMDTTGAYGVISIVDRIDEDISSGVVQEVSRMRWRPDLRTLKFYDLFYSNFAVPISFIYRREVFDEIGYYDEALPVCGDWDFALRFMSKYDIDLLKTDYALAFYHHRMSATGSLGNSIFAGFDKHEVARTKLANKYLREDMKSGAFGLGYLFNEQQRMAENGGATPGTGVEKLQQELELRINDVRELIYRRTLPMAKVKRVMKATAKRLPSGIKNKLKGGR